jgi:hypothetical protein
MAAVASRVGAGVVAASASRPAMTSRASPTRPACTGLRVLALADQAEPADELHARQQAVQAVATRCALDLAGHGLRALVVAAQRDDHGVQGERAGVTEQLPGLVDQPLRLRGAGHRRCQSPITATMVASMSRVSGVAPRIAWVAAG